MSAIRDRLEEEIGARAVGTLSVDGREIPLAFAGSEEQVVALLALAASQGWRVLPVGSGTKVAHGAVHEKPRFAISVRGISGVSSYERGDGTITARAGSTMAALAQVARSGGNHLTPDVAQPELSTLGGTLGAGWSGIDRLRYGPVRNHVLGMRIALSDGTIVKSGGRLVKNVTGYDLHRLYTGSRGTLCVILEASLRLFPAPEREVVLSSSYFGRDAAIAAASAALATSAKPTCVCVAGPVDGRWMLTVALANRTEVVEWERAELERIVGECDVHEGAAARASIEELRDLEPDATLRASVLPGNLHVLLTRLDVVLSTVGLQAQTLVQPGLATVDVALSDAGGALPDAVHVLSIARALSEAGAQVELRNAPIEARAAHDPLERVPEPARALMVRLKKTLDPAGRFADAARA